MELAKVQFEHVTKFKMVSWEMLDGWRSQQSDTFLACCECFLVQAKVDWEEDDDICANCVRATLKTYLFWGLAKVRFNEALLGTLAYGPYRSDGVYAMEAMVPSPWLPRRVEREEERARRALALEEVRETVFGELSNDDDDVRPTQEAVDTVMDAGLSSDGGSSLFEVEEEFGLQ